jgi:membrane protease YdiL (CAAX protease family)
LQLVTLIPTFILGYLLAYLFQKSNSLWPGIILHFSVNSFGFCMIYAVSQISI